MKKYLLLFFLMNSLQLAKAQENFRLLHLDTFLTMVLKNHPIAKQSDLQIKIANAELLAARGNFDPTLNFNIDQKKIAGVDYFNYTNSEITIPTWMGIKINGGFENNVGEKINNELTKNYSTYAGIAVPLLKDFWYDKRRAVLQQAKNIKDQTAWEQKNILNTLYAEAYSVYLNWTKEFMNFNLLKKIYSNNLSRFSYLKMSFLEGDRSVMDTIEAMTQIQYMELQLNEAKNKFLKQTFEMNNFLWENDNPQFLKNNIIPDTNVYNKSQYIIDSTLLNGIISQHPKVLSLKSKIDFLKTEQKLKFQSLLPQLNVKYQFLQKGNDNYIFPASALFENNYKYGVSLSLPIIGRSGIGSYKASVFKAKMTEWEMKNQTNLLENKLRFYYSEINNLKIQLGTVEKLNGGNFKLLNAETQKFELGETTLFVLNSREMKFLESQQKSVELKYKLEISKINLMNLMGNFNRPQTN